jgi:hypothetical protein
MFLKKSRMLWKPLIEVHTPHLWPQRLQLGWPALLVVPQRQQFHMLV